MTLLTGVIRVDLTPTTIQFLPSSFLDAVVQPFPQQPGPGGTRVAAPADYGMETPSLAAWRPVFAVRDFGFSISSPVLPLGPAGDQFRQDIDAVVNARIDYDLRTSSGTYVFANWNRGFDNDNAGNLITEGLVQRLDFRNYLGDIFTLESPSDSFIEWSGPIIATRVIPEPAAMIVALFAPLFVIVWFRGVGSRGSATPKSH